MSLDLDAQGTVDAEPGFAGVSSEDPIRAAVHQTVDYLRDQMDAFDFRAAATRTADWVRKNPAASAAIAVGLGFVVVYAIRRADAVESDSGVPTKPRTGILRRTAQEFGSEIATVAQRYEKAAARQATDLATAMASRAGLQANGAAAAQSGQPAFFETIRSAVASVLLNRISEWLRRP